MNHDDDEQGSSLAKRISEPQPDWMEVFIAAVIAGSSLIPQIGGLFNVLGTAAFAMHQSQNVKKMAEYFTEALKKAKEEVHPEALKTDKLKDLIIVAVEASKNTSSEVKLHAIANILCGCFTRTGSTFINQEGMFRLARDI